MTLSFALSVVITRYRRDISMAPAFCLSQVLVLAAVGPFAHPGTGPSATTLVGGAVVVAAVALQAGGDTVEARESISSYRLGERAHGPCRQES